VAATAPLEVVTLPAMSMRRTHATPSQRGPTTSEHELEQRMATLGVEPWTT